MKEPFWIRISEGNHKELKGFISREHYEGLCFQQILISILIIFWGIGVIALLMTGS